MPGEIDPGMYPRQNYWWTSVLEFFLQLVRIGDPWDYFGFLQSPVLSRIVIILGLFFLERRWSKIGVTFPVWKKILLNLLILASITLILLVGYCIYSVIQNSDEVQAWGVIPYLQILLRL
jgi:hypothetical protein